MFPFPLHKSSESKQRKKNWRLGARNRRKTFLVLRQNEMRVVSWPMFFSREDNLRFVFGVAHFEFEYLWIDSKINLRRLKISRSFKIVKIHLFIHESGWECIWCYCLILLFSFLLKHLLEVCLIQGITKIHFWIFDFKICHWMGFILKSICSLLVCYISALKSRKRVYYIHK